MVERLGHLVHLDLLVYLVYLVRLVRLALLVCLGRLGHLDLRVNLGRLGRLCPRRRWIPPRNAAPQGHQPQHCSSTRQRLRGRIRQCTERRDACRYCRQLSLQHLQVMDLQSTGCCVRAVLVSG